MKGDDIDVAIVGAGLGGSALAAVLAKRGVNVALLDRREIYPPDFRVEKLTAGQVATMQRLGIDGGVVASSTRFDELWIARGGKIVERRPNREYGIDYAVLVNALRQAVPAASRLSVRVDRVETSAERQTIHLADGESVRARLVVMATGLGRTLLDDLGIRRVDTTAKASLAIGFDLEFDEHRADIRPLTYYGESIHDRAAYLTIFPIAGRARANLFVYRDHDEAWSQAFREQPRERLLTLMPGLSAILGSFTVVGKPLLRPIQIYGSRDYLRDGLVLIGDAFATACPTSGTGADKVLTDVERLAALIPGWLASPGMGHNKVAGFYNDPMKRASDDHAVTMTAYARAMALDPSASWAARRFRNYHAQQIRYWLRRAFVGAARVSGA